MPLNIQVKLAIQLLLLNLLAQILLDLKNYVTINLDALLIIQIINVKPLQLMLIVQNLIIMYKDVKMTQTAPLTLTIQLVQLLQYGQSVKI